MRTGRGSAFLVAGFAAASALALACNGSDTVAGPTGSMQPAASLAGTWTGTYRPSAQASCSGSAMTVSLQQNGAEVTGSIASGCINGGFKGRVDGNQLTGNIDMRGCTGGAVSGELQGLSLTLKVGNFYQPLLMENEVVMPGGDATLSR